MFQLRVLTFLFCLLSIHGCSKISNKEKTPDESKKDQSQEDRLNNLKTDLEKERELNAKRQSEQEKKDAEQKQSQEKLRTEIEVQLQLTNQNLRLVNQEMNTRITATNTALEGFRQEYVTAFTNHLNDFENLRVTFSNRMNVHEGNLRDHVRTFDARLMEVNGSLDALGSRNEEQQNLIHSLEFRLEAENQMIRRQRTEQQNLINDLAFRLEAEKQNARIRGTSQQAQISSLESRLEAERQNIRNQEADFRTRITGLEGRLAAAIQNVANRTVAQQAQINELGFHLEAARQNITAQRRSIAQIFGTSVQIKNDLSALAEATNRSVIGLRDTINWLKDQRAQLAAAQPAQQREIQAQMDRVRDALQLQISTLAGDIVTHQEKLAQITTVMRQIQARLPAAPAPQEGGLGSIIEADYAALVQANFSEVMTFVNQTVEETARIQAAVHTASQLVNRENYAAAAAAIRNAIAPRD